MKKILPVILAVILVLNTGVLALDSVTASFNISDAITSENQDTLFRVAGSNKSFSLLDSTDNLIIANDDYGVREFDADETQEFAPQDENNIAYWLNNEFISDSYQGEKLPVEIIRNLIEYDWQTEAGVNLTETTKAAKVALLSIAEYKAYKDKIGIAANLNKLKDTSNDYIWWWTRTPYAVGSATKVMTIGTESKRAADSLTKNKQLVRPVFHLSDNFYKIVKLDAAYMGRDVKAVLAELSDAELSAAGYTAQEITLIKNGANSIVDVTVEPDWTANTAAVYDRHYAINEISFTITFKNNMSQSVKYYYSWSVKGDMAAATEISLSANETKNVKLKLPISAEGRYDIDVLTSFDGEKFRADSFDVSYINSIKSDSNKRGYATHLYKEPVSESIELLQASGVNIVRDGYYWQTIEQREGVYNFNNINDAINNIYDNDMDMIYVLSFGNKLYDTKVDNKVVRFGSEEEINGFVNYALAVQKKYPKITRYEIGNEPNLPNAWSSNENVADNKLNIDNYKAATIAVSKALKAVNPEIEIIAGVASNNDASEDNYVTDWIEFLSALLDDDTAPYIDAISFHTYMNFHRRVDDGLDSSDHRKSMDKIKQLMDEKGGFLKLYLTETGGYSLPNADPLIGQKTQAEKNEEMVRIFAEADAHGVDYTMIYNFVKDSEIDKAADISEAHYGVVTNQDSGFIPTETYYSVKNFLALANNAEYIGILDLGEKINAHLYLKGDEPVIVAWGRTAYNSTEENSFTFDNAVTTVDLFGKNSKISNTVSVTHSPVYIYGANKSYIKQAAVNMAKAEIDALATALNKDFSLVSSAIENISSSDDVYAVINSIFALSDECISESNIATKSNFARLYTAAEYMVKALPSFSSGEKLEYADVVKAYANYQKTMTDVGAERAEGAEEIFDFAKKLLDEVKAFAVASACTPDTDGSVYALNESGTLTIAGEASPGSITTIKLTDANGGLSYIGSATADSYGNYVEKTAITGEYGEYTLYVKPEGKDIYETPVSFTENTNYQNAAAQMHYGRIVLSEKLMEMSRDFLFEHADSKNFLLLDMAWGNVTDTGATATITVINNDSNVTAGTIVLAAYKNGKLISVVNKPLATETNKTENQYELTYTERPDIIKAFAWDGYKDIKPLKSFVAEW